MPVVAAVVVDVVELAFDDDPQPAAIAAVPTAAPPMNPRREKLEPSVILGAGNIPRVRRRFQPAPEPCGSAGPAAPWKSYLYARI